MMVKEQQGFLFYMAGLFQAAGQSGIADRRQTRLSPGSLVLIALLAIMPGYASAATYQHPDDPWEPFNRKVYAFNDVFDRWILKPVAEGYRYVMPDLADKAVTNFFTNLGDVPRLANNLFQLKGRQSVITAGRLVFNTTWGLGGLIDVGTMWDLPVQEEDFGQTMNHYGVPEGNYLVIPFFGPATVSDAAGRIPDAFMSPVSFLFNDPENWTLPILRGVDVRADLLASENLLSGDRYSAIRNVYLQRRDYLINDGEVEDSFLDDDVSDF